MTSVPESLQTLTVTQEQKDWLRWALLHHRHSDVSTLERGKGNKGYLQRSEDEKKLIESMFDAFGITEQDLIDYNERLSPVLRNKQP